MTVRTALSTLGVIVAACTIGNAAHAQSIAGSETPTAGFADVPAEAPVPAPAVAPAVAPAPAFVAPAPAPAAALSTTVASPTPGYTYMPAEPRGTAAPAARPSYGYAPASTYYAPQTTPQNDGRSLSYGANAQGNEAGADRGGDDSGKKSGEKEEHFRIGVLGGVGFPRPLQIEGMVKIEKLLGLGVEYSTLPSLSISGVETSFYAVAATARVFPFKNGFFLGFRAGRQHLGGDGTVTVAPYGTYHESVTVDSTFINPRIGFLWTWDPGITLGIDAGVQVPVGATVSSSLPPGTQANEEVMKVANTLGNSTLPTIDLLKIGFLL